MRVVVIQASTRTEINQLLFNTVCEAVVDNIKLSI